MRYIETETGTLRPAPTPLEKIKRAEADLERARELVADGYPLVWYVKERSDALGSALFELHLRQTR